MADNLGYNPWISAGSDILKNAQLIVWDHAYNVLGEKKNHPTFSVDEVATVWYCKSLQNWKGLFTTSLPDGRYYELTYNGERQEIYVDVYKKTHHTVIPWAKENNG